MGNADLHLFIGVYRRILGPADNGIAVQRGDDDKVRILHAPRVNGRVHDIQLLVRISSEGLAKCRQRIPCAGKRLVDAGVHILRRNLPAVIKHIHMHVVIGGILHREAVRCTEDKAADARCIQGVNQLPVLLFLPLLRAGGGKQESFRNRDANIEVRDFREEALAGGDELLMGPRAVHILRQNRVEIRDVVDALVDAVPVRKGRNLRREIIRKRHLLAGCQRLCQRNPHNRHVRIAGERKLRFIPPVDDAADLRQRRVGVDRLRIVPRHFSV